MDGEDLILAAARPPGEMRPAPEEKGGKTRMTVTAVAVAILGLGLWWCNRPEPSLPEVGPFEQPMQNALTEPGELTAPDGYTITALDEFVLEALIVSTQRYESGREADLSPVDFAVAWGPMTRQPLLGAITYRQSNRWYYFESKTAVSPMAPEEIATYTANVHIIPDPGNAELREHLLALKRGDAVRLSGYLVSVQGEDGWTWQSSRSRTDSGPQSCELFYVQEAAFAE